MADLKEALGILYKLEFSNRKNALEKNPTEDGLTWKGIYEKAHPTWDGWKIIKQKLRQYNGDMALTSDMLYDNERLEELTVNMYRRNFWDKMKLDKVHSQGVANEIFLFGVNAGVSKAVKLAQRIVGVLQDGIIGTQTITAINTFDDTVFSENYDILEQEHYEHLIIQNPKLAIYARGWKNRANYV